MQPPDLDSDYLDQLIRDVDPGHEPRVDLRDRLLTVAQLRELPPPSPLVQGLLDLDSVAVLYGPPGAGKTFVALDLAACVATGTRWHGHRPVTAGSVLYVAAEGAHGMPARIDAWRAANAVMSDPDTLLVFPEAVNLLSPGQVADLGLVVAEIAPALVVVDTLARSLVGGDENTAKDMGLAVAALDQIRRASHACVLVVHHAGKNRDAGARGSSALLGAADTMLAVAGDDTVVTITPEKQKHHPTGHPVTLKMEPHAGSVALVAYDGVLATDLSRRELDALAVLASIEVPEGVSFTAWKEAALEVGVGKGTVARARQKGLNLGLVGFGTNSTERSARYVLTEAGRSHISGPADIGGEQG